ncbi:MAG: hypothetical protein U0989_04815 [Azonexus sp.]|nr:hypothetical protein [Azonexus sp.]
MRALTGCSSSSKNGRPWPIPWTKIYRRVHAPLEFAQRRLIVGIVDRATAGNDAGQAVGTQQNPSVDGELINAIALGQKAA